MRLKGLKRTPSKTKEHLLVRKVLFEPCLRVDQFNFWLVPHQHEIVGLFVIYSTACEPNALQLNKVAVLGILSLGLYDAVQPGLHIFGGLDQLFDRILELLECIRNTGILRQVVRRIQ